MYQQTHSRADGPNHGPVTFAGCDNGSCPRNDCLRKLAVWEARVDLDAGHDGADCASYLPADDEMED